ncbi:MULTISPECIES: hypothetical protein [unclassified Campylobacter]|uniref:hypothetical protein n=2 Tax=Campylobacter TaxID=194 RepID=UPI001BDAB725|nr:hypothetical protein [Campylobacter sp. 2018MI10]MBT0884716.1 hypothetical protein [Campylobacter sp. 2018MI10]MBZ7992987.1 hypothetical protein [Campylobacter sp. RM9333]
MLHKIIKLLQYLSYYLSWLCVVVGLIELFMGFNFAYYFISAILLSAIYGSIKKRLDEIKFNKYFLIILALVSAYKYYEFFIKEPSDLIAKIIKANKTCLENQRYCITNEVTTKELNAVLLDKNNDEILKYLKEYGFRKNEKNNMLYFQDTIYKNPVDIAIKLQDNQINKIYYKADRK